VDLKAALLSEMCMTVGHLENNKWVIEELWQSVIKILRRYCQILIIVSKIFRFKECA
jgi:hypothetical protein